MALAIIHPKPESGGRGKTSDKLSDFSESLGIAKQHAMNLICEACTVLAYSRDLAQRAVRTKESA
jgi:hypothetical protein